MRLTFQDFLKKLAAGQLKNSHLTDDAQEGMINPEYEEQLLILTNQGLVDITTKKKIFEGVTTLSFVEGQNIYSLDSEIGAEYEDFVKVLEVVSSSGSGESRRTTRHIPKTNAHIIQPSYDTLRFSDRFMKDHGPIVDVRFHKKHPELTDSLSGEINLPTHLYELLVLYVSGLYLSHKGGQENSAKGDTYYGLYLTKMDEDTVLNSSSTSEVVDEDIRFQDRGFV